MSEGQALWERLSEELLTTDPAAGKK